MKKALSLLLILVLLFAMAPAAHAAKWEITGLNPNPGSFLGGPDLSAYMMGDFDLGDVYPDTSVFDAMRDAQGLPGIIPFDAIPFLFYMDLYEYNGRTLEDWFTNGSAAEITSLQVYIESLAVSPSKLEKMIQVRTRVSTHRDLFKPFGFKKMNVTIAGTTIKIAALDLRFKERLVSTEELEFEVDLYFATSGSRTDDIKFTTLTGTFKNPVTEVFANSVEADCWEGQVIDAQEYVQKITLVGNEAEDVLAHIKMTNGKKVYFVVDTDGDIKDEPIMDKYPTIEWAYTVYQVGLNTISGNFIELAGVDDSYYVYGKNPDGTMKYLGRGGEMFPFSAKYYISSEKLDLDDEAFEEDLPEEEEDEPGYNPSTGI